MALLLPSPPGGASDIIRSTSSGNGSWNPGRMVLYAHGPLSGVRERAGRKALAHQAAGMSPAKQSLAR